MEINNKANDNKKEKKSFISGKSLAVKLAFTAVFTAIMILANSFLTITVSKEFQFSVIIALGFYAGVLLGPVLGFTCGVLSDLLGWLFNSSFPYNPLINLSSGLFCLIPALMFMFVRKTGKTESRGYVFTMMSWVSFFVCFLLCTELLTSLGLWLYSSNVNNVSALWLLMGTRAIPQFCNSLVNYIIVLLLYIPLRKVKYFKNII